MRQKRKGISLGYKVVCLPWIDRGSTEDAEHTLLQRVIERVLTLHERLHARTPEDIIAPRFQVQGVIDAVCPFTHVRMFGHSEQLMLSSCGDDDFHLWRALLQREADKSEIVGVTLDVATHIDVCPCCAMSLYYDSMTSLGLFGRFKASFAGVLDSVTIHDEASYAVRVSSHKTYLLAPRDVATFNGPVEFGDAAGLPALFVRLDGACSCCF